MYNHTINSAYKNKTKQKFSNYDIEYKRKGFDTDNIINGKINAKNVEKAYKGNKNIILKNKNIYININMINNNQNQKYIIKKLNFNKDKMKVNGKLFMIKKHLGKYILEQYNINLFF